MPIPTALIAPTSIVQAEPDALLVAGRIRSAHLFGATVRVRAADFAWVNGTACVYRLPANGGERSFCGTCGTPLLLRAGSEGPWVHVASDTLDRAPVTDIFALNGDASVHNPQPGLNKERR